MAKQRTKGTQIGKSTNEAGGVAYAARASPYADLLAEMIQSVSLGLVQERRPNVIERLSGHLARRREAMWDIIRSSVSTEDAILQVEEQITLLLERLATEKLRLHLRQALQNFHLRNNLLQSKCEHLRNRLQR